jgi:hypothetical protein
LEVTPEIEDEAHITDDFGAIDCLEAGRLYRAEITETHDYDAVARIDSALL